MPLHIAIGKFMPQFILVFFFTALFFTGCSAKKTVIEPAWINKPNLQGKTGAVGSSKPQFKGKSVQRRVATARALDELAQQSGVEVGNIIMRNEKSSASKGVSSTQIQSIQRASGLTINAHIEEVWTDPATKEMYIWLVAD